MSEHMGIARKSLFLLSYNVFGGVLGYITLFFALRFVGQYAWGIYGSALGIAGILSIISSLGVDSAHVKKVTQKKEKEECMGAYILIKGFLGLIFLVVSFGGFYVMGNFFGYKFESPYLEKAVYIAILGMLLSSLANIFRTTYQTKLDARKSVVPLFVQVLVQDILIIIFAVYYKINPVIPIGYIGVLFTYAYLMGVFFKLLIYIGWAVGDGISVKRPHYSLVKEYILFEIPLALLGIVGTIQAYTDRTMLQFFWNSAEVGGYFSVQKLALFVTYFGGSVSFFLYPAQSSYYESRNHYQFFNITSKAERYLSLISAPFVMFTVVMAPEILNIFRSSLIPYSTPLIILIIYAYVGVINRPYGSLLTSANRPHEVMKVGIIQASANVVLNTLFIPKSIMGIPLFGLRSTGAALATLLSFLIGFVFLRYKAYKILGVKYERYILMHLLAGGVAAFVIFIIKIHVLLLSWYSVFGSFILFAMIYVGILYLLGEFGREEIDFVLRMFNINLKRDKT